MRRRQECRRRFIFRLRYHSLNPSPAPVPMNPNRAFAFATFCFFLSGVSALIYEICWIRKATLVFGSSTFALSTILAIFFAGLALGNHLFGRWGQQQRQPIRCYALLETALALFALASPLLFEGLETVYAAFFRDENANSLYSIGSRILLISLVLLPPTMLMGGTLPLFCRQLVDSNRTIAGRIGMLYGINTLGGVCGCLLAGFLLIPEIGVFYTICIAAAINLLAAAIAGPLPLQVSHDPEAPTPSVTRQDGHAAGSPLPTVSVRDLGLLFFIVGFVSIGNEVIWARFLTLLVRNSVYTYTITLSVVLSGIVIGSLIASRLFDKPWPLIRIFAVLQLLSSALTLFIMTLPPAFWQSFGEGIAPFFLLILIPSSMAGACFPLLNRLALKNYRQSASTVGSMTALNICGGIAGSLFAGFFALPALGLHYALLIFCATGVLAGIIAITRDTPPAPRRSSRAVFTSFQFSHILLSVLVFGAVILSGNTRLPQSYLGPESLLVDFEEGYGSLLSVVRKGSTRQLQIDRLWQGTDTRNHQIMAAHVPMLLHDTPQQVLVVGLGVGQTPSRFLLHDIDSLHVVDIEPKIFPFVRRNFDSTWMDDPRVRLVAEDGRTFVNHTDNRYDVISIEVGQVFRPGIESFYSVEFYENAKNHLQPGGIVAQFVPLAFFEVDQFQSILATFQQVFPQSILWYNTQEMLLLGSSEPLRLSGPNLVKLQSDPAIQRDLQYSHWGGPEHWLNQPGVFLGGFFSGPDQIRAMAGSAPVYRDDHPVLAYQVARTQHHDHNEVAISELLSQHLAPVTSIVEEPLNTATVEQARSIQQRNLNDLVANAYLTEVVYLENRESPANLAAKIRKALALNPDNGMANRMMGNAQIRLGRPKQAITYYRKAVALRENDPIAQRGLALAYGQTQDLDASLRLARKALNSMPEDITTLNLIGLVLTGKGRAEEAIRYLEKSLSIDPSNPETQQNLALARRMLKS